MLGGLEVLVVDDEEDARELLRTVLENYGATVTSVSSVEAIADGSNGFATCSS